MVFTYTFDQLKESDADAWNLRYMNYDYTIKHGGVNPDKYITVDSGTIEAKDALVACEKLYMMYNSYDRPKGYHGRCMSVSDIVNLWNNEVDPPVKTSDNYRWYNHHKR